MLLFAVLYTVFSRQFSLIWFSLQQLLLINLTTFLPVRISFFRNSFCSLAYHNPVITSPHLHLHSPPPRCNAGVICHSQYTSGAGRRAIEPPFGPGVGAHWLVTRVVAKVLLQLPSWSTFSVLDLSWWLDNFLDLRCSWSLRWSHHVINWASLLP